MKITIGILFAVCALLTATATATATDASADCLYDCGERTEIYFVSEDLKVPLRLTGMVHAVDPPLYQVEQTFLHLRRAMRMSRVEKILSDGPVARPRFLGHKDPDRMVSLSAVQLLGGVDTNYGRLTASQVEDLRDYIAQVAVLAIAKAAHAGEAQVIPQEIRVKVETGKLDIQHPLQITFRDGLSGRARTDQGILTEREVRAHRRAYDEFGVRSVIKARSQVERQLDSLDLFLVALTGRQGSCI